jgi:hypothetical protein
MLEAIIFRRQVFWLNDTDQKKLEGNTVVRREKLLALSSLPTKEHFSLVVVNTVAT